MMLLGTLLCCPDLVLATTFYAQSCSQTNIQTAIDSSSNGDTVIVPAGTCTSATAITLNQGATLQGAGKDLSLLSLSASGSVIVLDGTDGELPRITGFTIDGVSETYGIYVQGDCKTFRIDNIKFTGTAGAIKTDGYTYGVIDSCTFINAGAEQIDVADGGDGSNAWSYDIDDILGTANAVYIEDCYFESDAEGNGNAIDSNVGARWVFRYNEVTGTNDGLLMPIENHGYCMQSNHGTRSIEVYENTFTIDYTDYNPVMKIRGGDGVIYDNNVFGTFDWIQLNNYRSWNEGCAGGLCSDNEGYPCQDQTTELYIWDNYAPSRPDSLLPISVYDGGDCREHIQEDRDFFLEEKSGYTPYTYPHPLRGDGNGNGQEAGDGSMLKMRRRQYN